MMGRHLRIVLKLLKGLKAAWKAQSRFLFNASVPVAGMPSTLLMRPVGQPCTCSAKQPLLPAQKYRLVNSVFSVRLSCESFNS